MKHIYTIGIAFFWTQAILAQMPAFDPTMQPAKPNYAEPENWAALPFRVDAANEIPKKEIWLNDSLKDVDVFYIYPTIYTKGETWNASLQDKKLNDKIDRLPVRLQASCFNETARVYAPRYRQAIVDVFYHKSDDGNKALDLAYEDVRSAFDYYLAHYNKGRPIIIASHSQGTVHAKRLLHDYFDGKPLQKKLVAAYLVGFNVPENSYSSIPRCQDSSQVGCHVSWMSVRWGWEPQGDFFKNSVSTNPLAWTADTVKVSRKQGIGGIFLSPRRKYKHANTVQVHKSYLWVRTQIPFFVFFKNQHILDYNLFWYDIRHNAALRAKIYSKQP